MKTLIVILYCLAVPAFPQATVYVQTQAGIDAYFASASGQVSPIAGSPFAVLGQMEGATGSYVVAVGTDILHLYRVASNGAIVQEAGQINTQDYAGSECGNTDGAGAVLDRAGTLFYVQLYGALDQNGNIFCSAWQSYRIGADGWITFIGATTSTDGADGNAYSTTIPTISGAFAYGIVGADCDCDYFAPSILTPTGDLQTNPSFAEVDPIPPDGSDLAYFPFASAADRNGNLAVLLFAAEDEGDGNIDSWQMASYAVNPSTGVIASTNTAADMPALDINQNDIGLIAMKMDPTGRYVAVGGYPGLQVLAFNGAAPMTVYGQPVLPTTNVDQVAWDDSGHLYALSYDSAELYVFTVGDELIQEAEYSVPGAYGVTGLIVVPAAEIQGNPPPVLRPPVDRFPGRFGPSRPVSRWIYATSRSSASNPE
jgi:hypothetical protein